jgi:hypothetical protein
VSDAKRTDAAIAAAIEAMATAENTIEVLRGSLEIAEVRLAEAAVELTALRRVAEAARACLNAGYDEEPWDPLYAALDALDALHSKEGA